MSGTACPACAFHVTVPILDVAPQPPATSSPPASAEVARAMARRPIEPRRCVDCGHVFDAAFDDALMCCLGAPDRPLDAAAARPGFHLRTRPRLLAHLPAAPTVVGIGLGGGLLRDLAAAWPAGRFVGFDPQGAEPDGGTVALRAQRFDPPVHMEELRPDFLVARRILEYLPEPLAFLQEISFAAARLGLSPRAYIEVPCIDRALAAGRSVDLCAERGSHFTGDSFARMLSRCGLEVEEIGRGDDGELIFGLVTLGRDRDQARRAAEAEAFREAAADGEGAIRRQLAELHVSGVRVAVWGAAAASTAFMNRYGVDALRFPLVVESDPAKVGGFVSGTGQEIRFRDVLLDQPADVVLVPQRRRARDVLREIAAAGIRCRRVLIEHEHRLVDFRSDPHPYGATRESEAAA